MTMPVPVIAVMVIAVMTLSEYAINMSCHTFMVHTMSSSNVTEYYHFSVIALVHCCSEKDQGCNDNNDSDRGRVEMVSQSETTCYCR